MINNYEYSPDNGTTWISTDSVNTTHTIQNLTPGETYNFKVRASNNAGNGTASDTVPVTLLGFRTGVGFDRIQLTWTQPTAITNISKYQYQQNGDAWADIPGSTASTTSHGISALTPGTSHTLLIRAVDSSDNVLVTSDEKTVVVGKIASGTDRLMLTDADYFGGTMEISQDGNTLFVGAYNDDTAGENKGAVYIFSRAEDTWKYETKIAHGVGGLWIEDNNTNFGSAIAVSSNGNTLFVGAMGDNTGGANKGAVYIFTKNGNTWSYTGKIAHGAGNLSLENFEFLGSAIAYRTSRGRKHPCRWCVWEESLQPVVCRCRVSVY